MADKDKDARQPTHRAYSVIRREGQDDYWLNIGLVFPHKDGSGFNIIFQAFPLDGKVVCREVADQGEAAENAERPRSEKPNNLGRRAQASITRRQ
jgi:hypothetical protein